MLLSFCVPVLPALPFVGERLAMKIEEIIASGGLRRLEAVDKEKQAMLATFTKIHKVGQVVATHLVSS